MSLIIQENITSLEVFPLSGSLDDVTMDLLTKLIHSGRGHTNILVINEISMIATSAFQIAQAFVKHGSFD